MSATSGMGSVMKLISSVGGTPSVVCSCGRRSGVVRRIQCASVCADDVRYIMYVISYYVTVTVSPVERNTVSRPTELDVSFDVNPEGNASALV